jgi:[acyl-carrier-protein] S-malonyltransferase
MSENSRVRLLEGCLRHVACTPNRGEADADTYRALVIDPYIRLQKLQAGLKEQGQVTDEQLLEAFNFMRDAFEIKKVPYEEQSARIEALLQENGTGTLLGLGLSARTTHSRLSK